jgi:hypothetical protein
VWIMDWEMLSEYMCESESEKGETQKPLLGWNKPHHRTSHRDEGCVIADLGISGCMYMI